MADLLRPPTEGLGAPLLQEEGSEEEEEEGKGDLEAGAVDGGGEQSQDKEKKKGGASVGRLLALAKSERGLIVLGTVALLLGSLSVLALPLFVGRLIDDVGGQGGGACSSVDVGRASVPTVLGCHEVHAHTHNPMQPLGDRGPDAARHSLDTSTGVLLGIMLGGSFFTFVRGVCFNLGTFVCVGLGGEKAGDLGHDEYALP